SPERIVSDMVGQRPDGYRPHAIVTLRHRVILAIDLANRDHFPGVRSTEAQREGLVGIDLRGVDTATAASASSRRRCRRLSCRGSRRSCGRLTGTLQAQRRKNHDTQECSSNHLVPRVTGIGGQCNRFHHTRRNTTVRLQRYMVLRAEEVKEGLAASRATFTAETEFARKQYLCLLCSLCGETSPFPRDNSVTSKPADQQFPLVNHLGRQVVVQLDEYFLLVHD